MPSKGFLRCGRKRNLTPQEEQSSQQSKVYLAELASCGGLGVTGPFPPGAVWRARRCVEALLCEVCRAGGQRCNVRLLTDDLLHELRKEAEAPPFERSTEPTWPEISTHGGSDHDDHDSHTGEHELPVSDLINDPNVHSSDSSINDGVANRNNIIKTNSIMKRRNIIRHNNNMIIYHSNSDSDSHTMDSSAASLRTHPSHFTNRNNFRRQFRIHEWLTSNGEPSSNGFSGIPRIAGAREWVAPQIESVDEWVIDSCDSQEILHHVSYLSKIIHLVTQCIIVTVGIGIGAVITLRIWQFCSS